MATNGGATKWSLKGIGYEFCNCNPGCTCNFSGLPTSSDGSCKAFVANRIEEGRCGDVDLSGLTVAAIIDWPKAIHEGGGKAVFVVPPAVTDEQLGVLAQIFTGQLGGCAHHVSTFANRMTTPKAWAELLFGSQATLNLATGRLEFGLDDEPQAA